MAEKIPVELGTVQQTLLIPLYGRAQQTRKGRRGLIADPAAVRMVEAIDFDFRRFRGVATQGAVMRTLIFDDWVRSFLAEHPAGTVVEIGAGLNTRHARIDNGQRSWVDIDLPDTMELRRRLVPVTDRHRMVAGSILDDDWFSVVQASPGPYFFAIEAVLLYLQPDEVARALGAIAAAFPGARVAFDTMGGRLFESQARRNVIKKVGASFAWRCDDPREPERWGLRLLESRTFFDLPRVARLPLMFRAVVFPAMGLYYGRDSTGYRMNVYRVSGGDAEP